MSEPDITNYAYVWYKRDPDPAQLLEFTEEELEKIYEIILNYSYPCYLAGSELINSMSPEEKTKLLQHELLFIREKMAEAGLAHIIIMQIPRVLYDLFNFHHNKFENFNFRYECDEHIETIRGYNALTREYTNSIKKNIFSLNVFIMKKIISQHRPDIRESYNELFEELIIDSFISHIFELDLERINILRQTIHFEKQYSKGHTILYRGARNDKDVLTKHNDDLVTSGTSLSFNASMLSGCVIDKSNCTLHYATGRNMDYRIGQFVNNDKIKYSIKKFLLHDLSNEDSLFFIPPIHPFLQLYCSIELFHPRTKVGIDFKLNMSRDVRGLTCSPTFIAKSDYLVSNKTFEELNALYQRYKSTNVVNTWSSDIAEQLKQEQFMTARATTIQEAALQGARLAQQKAEAKLLEIARMKGNQIRARYLTKLGFGGKKSRKNKKIKQSATKSNKNKKKYNKLSRHKYGKNNITRKNLQRRCGRRIHKS